MNNCSVMDDDGGDDDDDDYGVHISLACRNLYPQRRRRKSSSAEYFHFDGLLDDSVREAMSLDVVLHSDELDRIMETSRVIVPASSSLWVHMILRFQIKDVKRMLSYASVFTWDPIPNTDQEDRRFRMTRLLPLINSATTKVFIGSFGLHACYMTSRLIIRDDRPLAINAYFIIDTTYSPFYELANVSEYLMTLICFPLFYGAIGMYCYLVTIACSQLERLKVNILNIKSSMDSAKDKGPITESTFYRMQKQLDECISHHQNILRLMHSLEEVCSPMLVCHFVLILGGMCFAGFSFVVTFVRGPGGFLKNQEMSSFRYGRCSQSLGNGLTMAQSVVVYTAFLIQLYAYCWFGGELTDLVTN
ncbi:hypothetical protein ANN_17274 [Periplaneta americana]|uniref:Odorant receptor n=1 Tax=Periplaneta americana TaxID=6978 RepID=A0ABQ8SSH2_PERAM|nr:hypothetical protein ANN_17274 [Periplaneta americana]